jgi:hypothetical protein
LIYFYCHGFLFVVEHLHVDLIPAVRHHAMRRGGGSHVVVFLQEPFRGAVSDYELPQGCDRARRLGKWNLTKPLQDHLRSKDAWPLDASAETLLDGGHYYAVAVMKPMRWVTHPCALITEMNLCLREYMFTRRGITLNSLLFGRIIELHRFKHPTRLESKTLQSMPTKDIYVGYPMTCNFFGLPDVMLSDNNAGGTGSVRDLLVDLQARFPDLRPSVRFRGQSRAVNVQVPQPWLQQLLTFTTDVICTGDLWLKSKAGGFLSHSVQKECAVRDFVLQQHLESLPIDTCPGHTLFSMDNSFFRAAAQL